MRLGKLAFSRQLIVRILIPICRNVLLVLLSLCLVLGTKSASVHVCDAVAAMAVAGGFGRVEVFVVVG